jgi:uncharacterized protein
MPDMDQEFVEYVVKALVSHPEDVHVRRSVDDMGVLLELTVNPEDMGKVIGKAGATAKSIRTLLRVLGSRSDARVNLKIIEPEGAKLPEGANADTEAPATTHVAEDAHPQQAAAPDPEDPEAARQADLLARTKSEFDDLDDLDL